MYKHSLFQYFLVDFLLKKGNKKASSQDEEAGI